MNQDVKPVLRGLDSFEINYLYPNPFNPSTIINFSVFESLPIKIDLYDINGRYLKTIVNDYYSNGNHDVLIDGANLSSGIYYVQITSTDLSKGYEVFH